MNILELEKEQKKGNKITIQERDISILHYLNEMGPQKLDAIVLRDFCDVDKKHSLARESIAKRRLKKLENCGYLKKFSNTNRLAHWYTSSRSLTLLETYKPEVIHLMPTSSIAINHLDHSERVSWSRIALEKAGLSFGFRSEKRLKNFELLEQKAKAQSTNHTPYIPDGVFLNEKNERVILEYEHTTKTKKQMEKRLNVLSDLMHHYGEYFEKVLIVNTRPTNTKKYRSLFYSEKFETMDFEELLELGGIKDVWHRYNL